MIDPTIPNKVIIAPLDTDFVSGVLPKRVLVSDGVWTKYVPLGERQSGNGFESDDCTAFSLTNVLETQFSFFIKNLWIAKDAMKFLSDNGYLDSTGIPNFSDRALGSMAGTTSAGNSLNKVAQTARTMGLVPESKWPSVFTNYQEYYKPVPQELLDLAQKFLTYFDIAYEQVTTEPIREAIQAAPLYVALATCGIWNAAEPPAVAWCNATTTNHAVELVKINNYQIFDSYAINNPPTFLKDLASDYVIPYLYKVLLTPKNMTNAIFVHKTGTQEYGFYLPALSPDAVRDKALNLGLNVENPDGTIKYLEAKDITIT